MKRFLALVMVAALWSAVSQPCAAQANAPPIVPKVPKGLPAFPGAQGFGAGATGGRGGKVIYVTNNDPSGPGSYSQAIQTPGPRIILFAVSGTIPYPFQWITEGDLTLIGTTAPGEGVEILGRLPIASSNIIGRGMRFSNRPPLDEDVVQTADVRRDVIVDHCSFRYGSDELVRFKGNGASLGRVDGLTVQYCILGPGLAGLGCHPWGAELDGYGSIHHNVWYHLLDRVPKTLGALWDWRNNLIYNCRNGYLRLPDIRFNMINNYVIDRPDSPFRYTFMYHPNLHDSGNLREADGKVTGELVWFAPPFRDYVPPFPVAPVTTHKADELEAMLTPIAGAFLPSRDATDRHFIEGLTARTGRIPYWEGPPGSWARGKGSPLKFTKEWYERWTPESCPPPAAGAKPPADSDRDGMPDDWEQAHGLNPADATDGPADADGDGYTTVEEFLNRTDPHQAVDYTKPENNVHTLHPAP
ncbi:MAG: hypothetical protein MUP47_00590 [Phycisphaerae bacterium]|nr:hypothetical protein [Phycisphaerae bacterium]